MSEDGSQFGGQESSRESEGVSDGGEDHPVVGVSHVVADLEDMVGFFPGPCNEPFEGIDAVSSSVLRDTLKRCVQRGTTVFLTSHILEIVERLCTDVGIIAKGKLVYQATMDQIRSNGSLEQRFLDAVGSDAGERQTLSWLEE